MTETDLIEPVTERLYLRQWRDSDFAPYASMSADAQVMEFYPATLSREESAAHANTMRSLITRNGWGFWALELKGTGEFIGFTGLHRPTYELPFAPCVEVGWRLARVHWGKGYATEAARAALAVGFDTLGLDEIVSFTSLPNTRSRKLMERLGMQRDSNTFEHPAVPAGHLLREHCLYRLSQGIWQKSNG